jgi:hypothetical protein
VNLKDGDLTEQKTLRKCLRYSLVFKHRGFHEFNLVERNNKKQANIIVIPCVAVKSFQTDSFQNRLKK